MNFIQTTQIVVDETSVRNARSLRNIIYSSKEDPENTGFYLYTIDTLHTKWLGVDLPES